MFFRFVSLYLAGLLVLFAVKDAHSQSMNTLLDQNMEQNQGQYRPQNLNWVNNSSLGMIQSAWLDPLQNLGEGQSRPAYSKFYWAPDLVLPIRVREAMVTIVNFPEWELIEQVIIGDEGFFSAEIASPSTLILYPAQGRPVGVDSNLVVFGRSGNKYVFYIRSESVNTERLTNAIIDIEVVGDSGRPGSGRVGGNPGGGSSSGNFTGAGGKTAAATHTRRFQKSDWIQNIPTDPSKFRFDLEIYAPNPDDVVIAPERVWRDDIFTYIDLGEKSLSMTQRPIVTLLVERMEIPVGFRTKGPNNRLIVVEGIGDMVLRNGKRIICIKLRRSDDAGLEFTPVAEQSLPARWDVPPPHPDRHGTGDGNGENRKENLGGSSSYRDTLNGASGGAGQGGNSGDISGVIYENSQPVGYYTGKTGEAANQIVGKEGAFGNVPPSFDPSKAQKINNNNQYDPNMQTIVNKFGRGSGFVGSNSSNISVELGTDADVTNLEVLWETLLNKHSDTLGEYEPFFSVDTPADGQGKELFHLRVGPIDNLDSGDRICSTLGRNGIFCSVVRTQ